MDDTSVASGFRGLSAIAFLLNALCAIVFMAKGRYLDVIIGLCVLFASLFVFMSIVQIPNSVVDKMNSQAEFIFTYKGRLVVDFFLSLFLFGMNGFGVACAIITLVSSSLNFPVCAAAAAAAGKNLQGKPLHHAQRARSLTIFARTVRGAFPQLLIFGIKVMENPFPGAFEQLFRQDTGGSAENVSEPK